MNAIRDNSTRLGLLLSLWLCLPGGVRAQGIPEPSLVLYGTIRNTAQNNLRVTWGTLVWQFRSETTGQTLTFTATVTNVLDQFSYVLQVPCEQVISTTLSSRALNLSGTAVRFDRSQVFYNGLPVSFANPAQTTVLLSARDRGRVERIDLLMALDCVDLDENSLCDDWEMAYLGYIGVDPNDDPDGDGLSNWAECKAGTDPLDPQSVFRLITWERLDSNSVRVGWQSTDGRYYSLLRYPNLLSTNYTVVQPHLFATTPAMTWVDTNAPPTGAFFYRILLEP
jgi:hypothetical protein